SNIAGGYLSDRIGRRLLYQLPIVANAAIIFPYFGPLNTQGVPLVVLAGLLRPIAPGPPDRTHGAPISETLTRRLRYSGASLGFQLASIAGGAAPLVATYLLGTFHRTTDIAYYISGLLLLSFIALVMLPDRSRIDHTVEYDQVEEHQTASAPRF